MARIETRPEFDAAAEYVVVRPFLCSAQRIGAGSPFNKTLVNHRRLRQLYDTGYLRMRDAPAARRRDTAPPALSTTVPAVTPDQNLAALRARYTELAGKKPGPMWDASTLRDKILELMA